jgi:hypothetical protein
MLDRHRRGRDILLERRPRGHVAMLMPDADLRRHGSTHIDDECIEIHVTGDEPGS